MLHTYVSACVTHDDLVTSKRECCVGKACRCTRECTIGKFCEVTWSGEWVVNFSTTLPVWLSWSSMEHRARCFRLPADRIRTKLDRKRSRAAGEFRNVNWKAAHWGVGCRACQLTVSGRRHDVAHGATCCAKFRGRQFSLRQRSCGMCVR